MSDDGVRVRVRGIYATALTRSLLDAGHEVVQPSPPIRRRFDADLPAADHDASVGTTDDRQGVGVAGDPDAVAAVRDHLSGVGRDALAWDDPTPRGAVFDGIVRETVGGGAVVDLGESGAEGYLPFDNAEGHVGEDDRLRVQVLDPAAPWADDRPVLDTRVRAMAGLATLVPGRDGVRVTGADDADARELAGMTNLLSVDVPDGWGVEWSRDARDAGMDALGDALARAADRARTLDDALEEPRDEPGVVAAPTAGAWVWFGRECRFALDDRRREVTSTMPGHHRTKAASRSASAGVDLAEALCSFDGEGDDRTAARGEEGVDFPFGVVADQFGPREGDRVRIGHGKPDGRLVHLGRGEVTAVDPSDGSVTLEREMTAGGSYDALDARREAGDVAITTFREGRWWYPTVYRDNEGVRKGTYVNVCTPVEAFPETVRYVDLHVDVVKHADGHVERVDDDELDAAVERGELAKRLAEKARGVATALERAL
ncbi:RNA-binding protein [Halobacteriales archaeon QS_6_71_20]|nr:MAG: RNA-binding protein [Halobacteriales archaeon QS_6_71_20]